MTLHVFSVIFQCGVAWSYWSYWSYWSKRSLYALNLMVSYQPAQAQRSEGRKLWAKEFNIIEYKLNH
jgi:hypothetical protein